MTQDQKAAFAARMERIQKGGVNTNRTIFFGMDEAVSLPKGGAKQAVSKRIAKSPWSKTAKRRGSAKELVLALTLGALAFPVALLLLLHPVAGLEALSAPLPGGPIGAGLALALVTAVILGLRRPVALVAAACGTLAMAAGFHNLVHAAPDLVAQVFPQGWVNTTLAQTKMGTLRPLTEFLTL